MLGNLEADQLSNVYASVDAFCLPSFSDPSPLSVIEALRWGLPLLISDRCGNHFEVIPSDRNGLTFNPLCPISIAANFDEFVNRHSEWSQMGQVSQNIFEKTFAKQKVLKTLQELFRNDIIYY